MGPQEYISDFRERAGRYPSQVELSKNLGLSPDRAIKELIQSSSFPEEPTTVGTVVPMVEVPTLLRVGLLIIAMLTFVLSVYFTGLWFRSMFNVYIAGAMSISMVSYMVLSPQAASYVTGIVKVPLWGTFAIALVFSMGSTVAGQYNQITKTVDVVSVNDRALLGLLQREESDILTSIEQDREQQRFHQRTLESLSQTPEERIENGPYIRTERNMVDELGYEIQQKESRVAEVREEIKEELSRGSTGATVQRVDFYSWLAQLVGMGTSQMEFLVSSLPAIFIDIIAALSLNVALAIGKSDKASRYHSNHK